MYNNLKTNMTYKKQNINRTLSGKWNCETFTVSIFECGIVMSLIMCMRSQHYEGTS